MLHGYDAFTGITHNDFIYIKYEEDIHTSGGSWISPNRGCQLPGGHQHTILPNFPQNCMKLNEFGFPGGRVPRAP